MHTPKNRSKKFLLFALAAAIGIVQPLVTFSAVYADENDGTPSIEQLINNGITNYVPGDICPSDGETSDAPSNNGAPAPGSTVAGSTATTPAGAAAPEVAALRTKLLKQTHLLELYKKAADAENVPWQAIAAIHYRESTNSLSNTTNSSGQGEGLFGFYADNRTRATSLGINLGPGKVSDDQFIKQARLAAVIFKEKAGSRKVTKDSVDFATIGYAFFGYNGRASVYVEQARKLGFSDADAKNGAGSPYVTNFLTPKQSPGPSWGQIKSDGGSIEYPANRQVGAWTIFAAMAGINVGVGGSCDPNAQSTGTNPNIDKVIKYALSVPEGLGLGPVQRMGIVPSSYGGAWCAMFATGIYKKAGYQLYGGQSGWYASTSDMLRTFAKDSKHFKVINPFKDKIMPGDFIWFDGSSAGTSSAKAWQNRYEEIIAGSQMQHTGLVVAVNGNKISTVEGNSGPGVTAHHTYTYVPGQSSGWTGQIFAFGRVLSN